MAYTHSNHHKKLALAASVYEANKHHDVPDTYIVRCIFPKHNIFISYATWKAWKASIYKPTPAALPQLSLF